MPLANGSVLMGRDQEPESVCADDEREPTKSGDARGIFASLLEELWAESAEADRALEDDVEGEEDELPRERSVQRHAARYAVQLPLPGLGARPFFVAQEPVAARGPKEEDEQRERWVTREVGRHHQGPGVRRRQDRIHALKGRFHREHRAAPQPVDADEVDASEETGATRCVRPRLGCLPHEEEVLIVRERRLLEGDGGPRGEPDPQRHPRQVGDLELVEADVEPREDSRHLMVEVVRYVVVKPAGLVAHLQALDGALAVCGE